MTNPSKDRGTRFESEVVAYFRDRWWPDVERRALAGSKDKGDIAGIPGWVLELKATKELNLAAAVDEARTEAGNADAKWFAAVIKRRRKGVSEAYAVMPLSQLADLIEKVTW